jgi:hypothetical protein
MFKFFLSLLRFSKDYIRLLKYIDFFTYKYNPKYYYLYTLYYLINIFDN